MVSDSLSVVEIRRLREDEFMKFMDILYRIFPDRANPNLFLELYEAFPDGFIVAIDNSKFVGFAVGIVTYNRKGKILLIGVDKNFRKRGIGSELLKRLVLMFSVKGINEIELEVRVSNRDAIRFYERRGFRKRERINGYYEDGEDAYIMSRYI